MIRIDEIECLSKEELINYKNKLNEMINELKKDIKTYSYVNVSLNVLLLLDLIITYNLYVDFDSKSIVSSILAILLQLSSFYVRNKKDYTVSDCDSLEYELDAICKKLKKLDN